MSNIGRKTSRAARDRPELNPRRITTSPETRRTAAASTMLRAAQGPRAVAPSATHMASSSLLAQAFLKQRTTVRQTAAIVRQLAAASNGRRAPPCAKRRPTDGRTKRGKRAVIARIITQPIARDGGQRSDSEMRIHARSCGIQQAIARP
ncbi:hypothetical protein F511_18324 [Dorcoceras hygrometricum]|uniref:Uncharacterized protein n=1 Tax=Dorcoceras hygrometricum TaxID=472368 RepID=A0A2Z7CNR1_9LAMI|nr:hypothetical protein F511_18324 [Dorcoceras hygrometricum]